MNFKMSKNTILASVKAKKIRSPVIEDHICSKNNIIQTPIPKTVIINGQ